MTPLPYDLVDAAKQARNLHPPIHYLMPGAPRSIEDYVREMDPNRVLDLAEDPAVYDAVTEVLYVTEKLVSDLADTRGELKDLIDHITEEHRLMRSTMNEDPSEGEIETVEFAEEVLDKILRKVRDVVDGLPATDTVTTLRNTLDNVRDRL